MLDAAGSVDDDEVVSASSSDFVQLGDKPLEISAMSHGSALNEFVMRGPTWLDLGQQLPQATSIAASAAGSLFRDRIVLGQQQTVFVFTSPLSPIGDVAGKGELV